MPTAVASELHRDGRTEVSLRPPAPQPFGPMNKDLQIRFTAILIGVVTAAAIAFAWINFTKERQYEIPYDGVWWVEDGSKVVARQVDPQGPGEKAGIKPGDALRTINGAEINGTTSVVRQLFKSGTWSKTTYALDRQSVPLEVQVIEVDPIHHRIVVAVTADPDEPFEPPAPRVIPPDDDIVE